ncbi:MAG: oligoendopeptidase F [Lachnospiraceae bacterium]|nr:oligoendopeptidase F [Lachnospiraceae bacterium]
MNADYMWDLTKIYASDDEFYKNLDSLKAKIPEIAKFSGKLKDVSSIKECLDLMMEIDCEIDELYGYAFLRNSEDTRAEDAKSMYAKAMSAYVEYSSLRSYFEPEILSLPDEELKKIISDDDLKEYQIYLSRIYDEKKHTLSKEEERILSSLGEVLGSPGDISAALEDSDMKFGKVLDKDGKEVEVNGANFTTLQASNDRVLRKNAYEKYYKNYEEHINTFSQTMSANVKNAVVNAKLRHYPSSREMASDAERVPGVVYLNLIDSVRRHLPDMHRYVKLRKKLLGVDELHFYDVYAPLLSKVEPKHYTFEEAKEMLYETVSVYGDEYLNTVKRGCKEKWIDVYPNVGKHGGAYSSGTYRTEPYILMNFTGTLDSVSTLVHEMGHSMQTYFSNKKQPYLYSGYTLFVAEVASTVNENLLVENLLSKTEDPKERLVLLNQYLENFKGTVFRQTMFAEFEKMIHEASADGTALTPQFLCDTYSKLNEDYFGDEMIVDDFIKYEWARIPHFYRPFYVYKYATSYSAAVALSEGIRKEAEGKAEGNIKKYLEFLSMGSSLDPLDELKHAGVDLSTTEAIDRALSKFHEVLDEAERLADMI